MSGKLRVLGLSLCVVGIGIWAVQRNAAQEKPKDTTQEAAANKPADKAPDKPKEATPAAATSGKPNPVKATPEVIAEAKKVFGYDCSMCHGDNGDGKGDLVESMKLQMKNWHESTAIDDLSDQAIYDLIVKGKDKMVGEGDRLAAPKVWGLVHYVRALGKKKAA